MLKQHPQKIEFGFLTSALGNRCPWHALRSELKHRDAMDAHLACPGIKHQVNDPEPAQPPIGVPRMTSGDSNWERSSVVTRLQRMSTNFYTIDKKGEGATGALNSTPVFAPDDLLYLQNFVPRQCHVDLQPSHFVIAHVPDADGRVLLSGGV